MIEQSYDHCGGSRACRAERRPPLRYGRHERSEHDRSEARPSCDSVGHNFVHNHPIELILVSASQFANCLYFYILFSHFPVYFFIVPRFVGALFHLFL